MAPTPLEATGFAPRVALSPKPEVTLTWEARTAKDGLVFRVYRTSADGEVAVVAERPAEIGYQIYNVSDRSVPQEIVVYHLVLISHEREFELVTVIRISTQTCDSKIAVMAPSPDTAVAVLPPFISGSGRFFVGGARTGRNGVDSRPSPEPPVPRFGRQTCELISEPKRLDPVFSRRTT
jgi:hypothetical protein